MEEVFWADKAAVELVNREKKLKRGTGVFRAESGIGASGIPHIGSCGDAIRNYAIVLALKDLGVKAELIAFSDDRDGLRKVPLGFPNSLEKSIGTPVSDIKDPFGCHDSYAGHMGSLLIDALEKIGVEFKFQSGTETYKKGLLNEQIEKLLLNQEKIKKIVKDIVGQDLVSVYFPVCEKCGKVYTTRVLEVFPDEHRVKYACDQEFSGKNKNAGKDIIAKGCGFEGEASYFNGTGKLAWKCEFAARWDALKIMFEAVGKDILDSVKVNDEIDRKILRYEPPVHLVYEMFLDKGGGKISKSVGNVFTPQDWLRFGSPESIRLLMLKRFVGTREIAPQDIPVYMDEINYLESVYFGEEKIKNEKESKHLKRLFEYVNFLKPKSSLKIPYNNLVNLAKIVPKENRHVIIKEILTQTKHIKEKLGKKEEEELKEKILYASNWAESSKEDIKKEIVLTLNERSALGGLKRILRMNMSTESLQNNIFDIANKNGVSPSRMFQIIYQIVLNSDRGPRAGFLIKAVGESKVISMIDKVLG